MHWGTEDLCAPGSRDPHAGRPKTTRTRGAEDTHSQGGGGSWRSPSGLQEGGPGRWGWESGGRGSWSRSNARGWGAGVGVQGGWQEPANTYKNPKRRCQRHGRGCFGSTRLVFRAELWGGCLAAGPGCPRMMLWDLIFHGQTPKQPQNPLPGLPPRQQTRGDQGRAVDIAGLGGAGSNLSLPTHGMVFSPLPSLQIHAAPFSGTNPDATTFPWARWQSREALGRETQTDKPQSPG